MKKEGRFKWFAIGVFVCLLVGVVMFSALAVGEFKQATLFYNDIKITLDGEALIPRTADGNPVEPFAIDGTTYLPVRGIASAL